MKKLIFAAAIGSLLSLQAESLNARLSYRQGVRYREGKMCPRDLVKSVDCFYTAATQDCVWAMEMLAGVRNGWGTPRDLNTALELYSSGSRERMLDGGVRTWSIYVAGRWRFAYRGRSEDA